MKFECIRLPFFLKPFVKSKVWVPHIYELIQIKEWAGKCDYKTSIRNIFKPLHLQDYINFMELFPKDSNKSNNKFYTWKLTNEQSSKSGEKEIPGNSENPD